MCHEKSEVESHFGCFGFAGFNVVDRIKFIFSTVVMLFPGRGRDYIFDGIVLFSQAAKNGLVKIGRL